MTHVCLGKPGLTGNALNPCFKKLVFFYCAGPLSAERFPKPHMPTSLNKFFWNTL